MADSDNRDDFFDDMDDDKSSLGRTVKKLFTAGLGAAFMTEESIRTYVSDLKLPKDAIKLLIQGAQKSKDELTQRVSREILEMLEKVDWTKEASRFLQRNKFRIQMDIEILPREDGEAQVQVRAKKQSSSEET